MITWYKPSEKMPEVGDWIVIFPPIGVVNVFSKEELAIIANNKYKTKWEFGLNSYWAYAKDFNFPNNSEEK